MIKGIAIKSRHASELLRAYQDMYKWCETRGFKPDLHRMDNETSGEVEEFITSQRTDLQYSPPGRHCAPAEKAVQTYKSCFKSVTASLPSTFPVSYWCHLLEQGDLAVNIVRPCRQNPKLSAWAATEGEFHFGSTPIAPPGTEMLMYVRPENRKSFGHNANKAWYVGPCMKHYRTFKGIVPSTGKVRMTDTVKMKHHAIAIPKLTPADRILEATRQLDRAIKQLPKEGPMDELTAIELLRKVLLGENCDPLPMNSVQRQKERERAQPAPQSSPEEEECKEDDATVKSSNCGGVMPAESLPTHVPSATPSAAPSVAPNYISDDEEEEDGWDEPMPSPVPGQGLRRSKRVIEQLRRNEMDGLERVAALAASESAAVPDLALGTSKYSRGYAAANQHLQMDEWAFETYFAGAIVDEVTGRSLEYRDLIKDP